MMETNPNFIFSSRKFWKTITSKEKNNETKVKKYIEVYKSLLNIFHIGNYYHYIVDLSVSEFYMVSENIKNVLGYDCKQISLEKLLNNIHPDDQEFVSNFETKIAIFFENLPLEKIALYKAQYDFRIRKKDGKYVRILHQTIHIDYDAQGINKTLSLDTDISHIKENGNPCLSIIALNNEPSYYNIDNHICDNSPSLFTKRELEILRRIVENKSSQQIAEELFISLYTVNTHRRNIIKKAKVKTPLDLVQRAIKEAWIQDNN